MTQGDGTEVSRGDQSDSVTSEARIPITEAMPGLRIHDLPSGSQWQFAFLLIKYLDDDGEECWAYRTSSPPNRYELLGAASSHVELLRRELLEDWD